MNIHTELAEIHRKIVAAENAVIELGTDCGDWPLLNLKNLHKQRLQLEAMLQAEMDRDAVIEDGST